MHLCATIILQRRNYVKCRMSESKTYVNQRIGFTHVIEGYGTSWKNIFMQARRSDLEAASIHRSFCRKAPPIFDVERDLEVSSRWRTNDKGTRYLTASFFQSVGQYWACVLNVFFFVIILQVRSSHFDPLYSCNNLFVGIILEYEQSNVLKTKSIDLLDLRPE